MKHVKRFSDILEKAENRDIWVDKEELISLYGLNNDSAIYLAYDMTRESERGIPYMIRVLSEYIGDTPTAEEVSKIIGISEDDAKKEMELFYEL